MADAHFTALMRGAYVQNFPAQIELITEGEPSDFLHIVLSGSVDLFSAWNGRDTSMATVRPISTFILAATIKDAPYLMSARTLEKKPDRADPQSGCARDLRRRQRLCPCDRHGTGAVLSLCHQGAEGSETQNLARAARELPAQATKALWRRGRVRAGFSKKRRLASVLGMTPENLSRAFKGLQPYGVTVTGTRITIGDQADLERFAKPNPLIDDFTT